MVPMGLSPPSVVFPANSKNGFRHIVFEGPVLGPAKDRDWTGPGLERTAKLKDCKRPDRVKTAKDRCELDRLRPVETDLW